MTRRGRREASRIALTSHIKSKTTGEVRSLAERGVVFEELLKLVKPQLRYTSLQVFKDGHEEEDHVQLMTEAAARLAKDGFFARMPGRHFTSKK